MINYFNDIHSFLLMGGYAKFVWPAYGVVFLVLFFQYSTAKRKFKKYVSPS